MAGSLSDLIATTQNAVQVLNGLRQQLASTFPQASSISLVAPSSGNIVFESSVATGFLAVTTSSGAIYRVPLYPST